MKLIRKRSNWRPSGANNEEIQIGALRAPIIRRFNLKKITVGENMSLGEDGEKKKKMSSRRKKKKMSSRRKN